MLSIAIYWQCIWFKVCMGYTRFLSVKLIIIFELEIKDLFANKSLTLRKYTYTRTLNKGFTNGFVSLLCYGQLQCGCGFR